MKRILFVCTGNICRSSMAEGLLRDAIEKDEQLSGSITAVSAGVAAFDGERASENSVKVLMDNWKIDISAHKSRRITDEEVKSSDLILTMTRRHKDTILACYPWAKGKVFTLKEYVDEKADDLEKKTGFHNDIDDPYDIADPYGMPFTTYKKCGKEIKYAIDRLILRFKTS